MFPGLKSPSIYNSLHAGLKAGLPKHRLVRSFSNSSLQVASCYSITSTLVSANRLSQGIYISVPFCGTKCSFRNFASGVFSRALFDRYAGRVCAEIEAADDMTRELVDSWTVTWTRSISISA